MLHPTIDTLELVNKIFDSSWVVETTKVCLSLIQEVPESLDILAPEPAPAIGSFRLSTGVTRTEVSQNEQGIIDMLFGVSRRNIGEDYQMFSGVNPIERTYLSTASLAELVYKKGTVTLVNPMDAVTIYDDISNYLKALSDKQVYEIGYHAPPVEDIEAFKNLMDLLEGMAESFSNMHLGVGAIDLIRQLAVGTATGSFKAEEKKLVLDGSAAAKKVGATYGDSPYLFSRG